MNNFLDNYMAKNIFSVDPVGEYMALQWSFHFNADIVTSAAEQTKVFPVAHAPDKQNIFLCLDEELSYLIQQLQLDKQQRCSHNDLEIHIHCEGNSWGAVSVGKHFYNLRQDFDTPRLVQQLETAMQRLQQNLQQAGKTTYKGEDRKVDRI